MAYEPLLGNFLVTVGVASSAVLPAVSMTHGILSISVVYGLCACNLLTLVSYCIKSIVMMSPNLLINKKPCGGSILPCYV